MSRKPPKLFPIEDKVALAPSDKRVPECMPPLKPGGSIVDQIPSPADEMTSATSTSRNIPMLRRSAPARNFLNSNGAIKRRFIGKGVSTSGGSTSSNAPSTTTTPIRTLISPTPNKTDAGSGSTNGCGSEDSTELTETPLSKVNGTISNGISSSKSNEPTRSIKRQKSLDVEEDEKESVESDSHQQQQQQNRSINGRKAQSSTNLDSSNNSVSLNNSQNNSNSNLPARRTSRYSQSGSSVVTNSRKSVPQPPSLRSDGGDDPSDSEAFSDTIPSELHNNSDSESPSEPKNSDDQDQPKPIDERILKTPKIIRQGDTVIKSYIDDKTGRIIVFEKGMNLEVCDFGSGKWYPAKVSNINWNKQEILVHYSNWSSRFDEWISMQNNRLRPSKNTNVVKLQYVVGEKVEAIWPGDNQKYPGTILQVHANDMYEVLFEDDGIKMKRSENQLFKVSQEDPPLPVLKKCVDDTPSKPPSSRQASKRAILSTPARRRSLKSNALQSTINQDKVEPATTPAPKSKTAASKSTPVSDEATEPLTLVPSRPAHFSVFDVPKEDLGKRKRSTPNYYVMAKGNPRGFRRPRSEGMAGSTKSAATSSAPTTDDEGAQHEDSQVSTPDVTESEIPSLPPCPARRRKSTVGTKVASAQPSPTEPKPNELPVTSAPPSEEVTTVQEPEKGKSSVKRRQPSSTPGTPTPQANAVSADLKPATPIKLEADKTPQVADSATTVATPSATPPLASPPAASTSRRPRSSGSVLALLPAPTVHADVPKDTKVDSGFVDESGNPIIIEQNDGNGFWQCPLPNCGKNFRKDSLLKMHLKHYHPELKPTCLVANVVQMAQARHAFESYSEHPTSWPKANSTDTPSTRESSPVGKAGDISTPEVQDPPSAHKKTLKSTPPSHTKDMPVEKISPQGNIKSEQDLSPLKHVAEGSELTPDPSLALTTQSPRLRHRRTFVWTKSGHRKSTLTTPVTIPRRKHGLASSIKDDVAIGTDGIKKNKLSESTNDADFASLEQSVDSPSNSLPFSNTPSPSVVSDQKSEFSIESCSGSSSSEPYLVPPYGDSDTYSPHGRQKGRWGKSHIRRGLMSSGIRRSASGMVPSATSILWKKRLGTYRKLIGKRSRQKCTSILSRISSGRMRVILESLNRRSMKRKRFLATRRGRDVKVDVINCICSNKTEFGLMIQCELCLCWQHGSCFNVQTNSQLPDFYACQSCSEPEKARLSRKYEWAESEFYKLGKMPSFPFAPSFPKEDARTLKMCTNLTSDLAESYGMIKSLKFKERICFGHPEHPQLYQWSTARQPPQEEIQRDKFHKYFEPVLRRLLLENKSDPTYPEKLKQLAETRVKLRKYSDAIESARSTIKKKLGCRAAAFLEYICESVLGEMVKHRRLALIQENGPGGKKETTTEIKKRSAESAYYRLLKVREEVRRRYAAESKLYTISPSKSNLTSTKIINKSSQQSFMNGASINFSMKGAASSQGSNGLHKDIATNIKDFSLLKRYLKERRTLDSNISMTITRMSQEFPDDWKNLMKLCRAFVEETSKETAEEEKVKWVFSVIVTFNNLKILLRQIYSETNTQKQKNCASEFEKSTIKLFDLFGVGLTEDRLEMKKISPKVKNRRIRGLETLDMVADSNPNLDALKLGEIPASVEEERNDILDRLGSSSEPVSKKECNDLKTTAKLVTRFPNSESSNTERKNQADGGDYFFKARGLDGRLSLDFTGSITLQEAIENIPDFNLEECTEENVELRFDDEQPDSMPSTEADANFTGIIPVPAASRITSDVCRKNLVQDILLQQQQIDLYLDKIEGQIIKLASQSRFKGVITSMKPSDLSMQRDKMLHSLELVNRLTKTMIGENDAITPRHGNEMEISETTVTDDSSSSGSSTSASDDDNTSNYSGSDTETADEGDNSGDDELLDV